MFIDKDMQKRFLAECIVKKTLVSLYLRNGIKTSGIIVAMTDDIIFFNTPVPHIIYKRHVNAIFPEAHNAKPVIENPLC